MESFSNSAKLFAVPKKKTIRDKKYIDKIRRCMCLVCLVTPCDPHHVPMKGHGGKGLKTDDTRAIPLCSSHHREYHQIGRDSFAAKYQMDYEEIISRLNTLLGAKHD